MWSLEMGTSASPPLLLLKPLSLNPRRLSIRPPFLGFDRLETLSSSRLPRHWSLRSIFNLRAQAQKDPADMENGVDTPLLMSHKSTYDWKSVAFSFLFPALGGLLFGYDIGATSGASLSITSATLSGVDWYKLTSIQTGLVVSGSLYGAVLGCLLAFNIADALGRRRELITAAAIYLIGSLLTSMAPDFAILIAGRLIYGIGIGLAMHAAPMYISETSPSDIRGTLVSLKEAFIVGGILLGYLAGNLEIDVIGGWRWMYGFAAPIALVMGIGMWWLPPSPRWLLLRAMQGKSDLLVAKKDAASALCRFAGNKADQSIIESQINETLASSQSIQEGGEARLVELFQGSNFKALSVGMGLVFFQQVTGQPSVLYYAASILQSAGISAASDATRVSVFLGFFKLLMTVVAVLFVDKIGRRPLLIGGVTGIVISLFLLASYFSFGNSLSILAIIALLSYVGCYQISFGPISWLMISEIFSLRTRGRALSISTVVNFGSNALVALAFAPLQDLVGASATFIIFGVVGVVALLFIIFSVPETKGLSLEEIEATVFSKIED